MKRADRKVYHLHRAPLGTRCPACHRDVGGETVCLHYHYYGTTKIDVDDYCWRCEHTLEGTELFLNHFSLFLRRVQRGPWYYLNPRQDQPSLFEDRIPLLPPALGGHHV